MLKAKLKIGINSRKFRKDNIMLKNQEAEVQEYSLRPDTIILLGTARLPEKIRPKDSVGYLAIYPEIDPVNSEIVDVSTNLMPSLGEKIIHNALLGHEIKKGIQRAIKQIEMRFYGITKRAVIAALEDAYKSYGRYLEENK